MTPELTAETLNELERLEQAATKGPWRWAQTGVIDEGYIGPDGQTTVLFGEHCEGAVSKDEPDGQFLSALRNAAKPLIAAARERDELRERVRELEAKIEDREQDAMAAD